MMENEKSRPRRQPEAGRGENAACSVAAFSGSDFITVGGERQSGFIAGLLSYGPESGQTITDLERLTGWRSREIRKQIELERRTGTPILSDCQDCPEGGGGGWH